ncbi:MAG TPA: hypothetical protein VN517_19475 [Terriglobales bacterium]|nr:hypothetical protein [Terriglobales bacterium]
MVNIKLFPNGNRLCALIGPELQTGLAGFGKTPAEALRDLAHVIETHRFDFSKAEADRAKPKLEIVK